MKTIQPGPSGDMIHDMDSECIDHLKPRISNGGQARQTGPAVWRLEIPAGPAGDYRLAQLDDYAHLPRSRFPWLPPLRLRLHARASAESIPGTWGFGLWNDPFGAAFLSRDALIRLPALPDTAWFFFASPPNYLTLRDDLPGQGNLAATFCSPKWPEAILAPALFALPLLAVRPVARLLRRLAQRVTRQSAACLSIDPTEWRSYELVWQADRVRFSLDGNLEFETSLAPKGPLALVFWVDNQYASFYSDGRIGWGALANPNPAWVEIRELLIEAIQ
jgi:hypothetical protein